MRQYKIKIGSVETLNRLERLQFDIRRREELLARPINEYLPDEELLSVIQYRKILRAELQESRKEIASFIPDELIKHKYTWAVDREKSEFVINIHCNCEIGGGYEKKN